MHQLGVRHVQVPSDRLVGVQPGLRQRVPPQRRSDLLLLRNAVRGANLGSPERPLRAEARAHRHDHVALAFRGRLNSKKKPVSVSLGSIAMYRVTMEALAPKRELPARFGAALDVIGLEPRVIPSQY